MTLGEKLEQWATIRRSLDKVEEEIRQEIMSLGKSQKLETSQGVVSARYTKPRPRIDYEGVAKRLGVENQAENFQSTKTDWRMLVAHNKTDDHEAIIEEFTDYGPGSVTLKLADAEDELF